MVKHIAAREVAFRRWKAGAQVLLISLLMAPTLILINTRWDRINFITSQLLFLGINLQSCLTSLLIGSLDFEISLI
jgi:hypothetical protein